MSSFRRILGGALSVLALAPAVAHAREYVAADGPGGTYALLDRVYGLELPDCAHMVDHITEEDDAELGKFVFVFHAHVVEDNDRCKNFDRQRTELRGRSVSVQGPEGSTVYYRWKFKLPTGFQTSGNFTHIFQIKAYGNGFGSGSPIMTLTPRNDTFAIDGRIGVFGTTSLAKVLGVWVVADLKITHANAGRVEMTIKRHATGEVFYEVSRRWSICCVQTRYHRPKRSTS